jgi:molecular chaperone GrpE
VSERTEPPSTQPGRDGEPKVEQLQLEQLQQELAASRGELEARDHRIDELSRAYSALLTEQKEIRGRLEREKDRVLEAERGKIATALLQVGDEIERALSSAHENHGPLAKGVQLIHENLGKTLASLGLERLSLVGTPFDPNLAEVVDVVPVDEQALDGQVAAEVAPAYKLGDRLVRPGRVRVARFVPKAASRRE